MEVLAYENARVMSALLEALQKECVGGEYVIYRHPFRWMRYTGEYRNGIVMPNCYEMFSLESILAERKLEARLMFEHAAIVREADVDHAGSSQ
jgi:hypothetical protein